MWLDAELLQNPPGDQGVHSARIDQTTDVLGPMAVRRVTDSDLYERQSHVTVFTLPSSGGWRSSIGRYRGIALAQLRTTPMAGASSTNVVTRNRWPFRVGA